MVPLALNAEFRPKISFLSEEQTVVIRLYIRHTHSPPLVLYFFLSTLLLYNYSFRDLIFASVHETMNLRHIF